MSARPVTADQIQALAFDHTACCNAALEFEDQFVYLQLGPKHGGLHIATAPVEVTA